MNLSLEGKYAVVCGSTQGIGLAIAEELALLGANCTLIARNEEALKAAVHNLDIALRQQHNYLVRLILVSEEGNYAADAKRYPGYELQLLTLPHSSRSGYNWPPIKPTLQQWPVQYLVCSRKQPHISLPKRDSYCQTYGKKVVIFQRK